MYYTLNDDVSNVNNSLVYYRLRQVDIDGFSSFSKVVSVRLKKTTDFTVSPNPFNSYVNINIDWKNTESTILKIYTMSGREVFSKTIKMYKGTNYIQLNELSALPSGNYLLQFNSAEGRIFKQANCKEGFQTFHCLISNEYPARWQGIFIYQIIFYTSSITVISGNIPTLPG
jgi:hypothetical protein